MDEIFGLGSHCIRGSFGGPPPTAMAIAICPNEDEGGHGPGRKTPKLKDLSSPRRPHDRCMLKLWLIVLSEWRSKLWIDVDGRGGVVENGAMTKGQLLRGDGENDLIN